jgi:hypothetical protein
MNMKKQATLKDKAVEAMNRAVAQAIEDYRKAGEPVPVWKNNKVVMIPPILPVAVQENPAPYTVRPTQRKKPATTK